jgi:Zn-dependent protease
VSSYRDYDSSPLGRFLQLVLRTFAIGTFFGVHVRMYWAALILLPLLSWRYLGYGAEGFAEECLRVAIGCVGLFGIIWTHEMGHIWCGRRFGIGTDLITLSPLGGLAHMNAPASTPKEELWIALAGPAVHALWLLVCWPIQLLLPPSWTGTFAWTVYFLVATNLTLLGFNLLPIFPLDGGRALRALLAMRMHPNLATRWATAVGIAGGAVLALLGLFRPGLQGSIGLLIGLSCISASLQERQLAKHVLIYQQARRELWEVDPDAWKRGADPRSGRRRQKSWFTRWREERAARRTAAAAAAAQRLAQEVDAVLERVHQVGMGGLSASEKAVLQRASKQRRGTG